LLEFDHSAFRQTNLICFLGVTGILQWWMQAPDAESPDPGSLRAWQRFVSDNLEFRLGVGIGAVVAQAWSEGAGDNLTPELATWRAYARLPWFGFWARELLRWGTLDPLVAFCLAQGLAETRELAATLRSEFDEFLKVAIANPTPDDFIDPVQFLSWQRQRPKKTTTIDVEGPAGAVLAGTDGHRGTYNVIPIRSGHNTIWLDAAGFALATSRDSAVGSSADHHHDFELTMNGGPQVTRIFRWVGAR
jgi:hypothetical protein